MNPDLFLAPEINLGWTPRGTGGSSLALFAWQCPSGPSPTAVWFNPGTLNVTAGIPPRLKNCFRRAHSLEEESAHFGPLGHF